VTERELVGSDEEGSACALGISTHGLSPLALRVNAFTRRRSVSILRLPQPDSCFLWRRE